MSSGPLITINSCITCNNECETCLQTNTNNCTTCKSLNASPNSITSIGCLCDTGFFGNSPLLSLESCSPCNEDCLTCTQADICTTCIATNAESNSFSNIGCLCKIGYFGTPPLSDINSCSLCYSDCFSCIDAISCTICISENAVPDTITGISCICESGYYQIDSNPVKCHKCPEACITCNDSAICLDCNVTNANPHENGECICPDNAKESNYTCSCNTGYYMGYDSFNEMNFCIECYPNCAECNGSTDKDCISCKGELNFDSKNKCNLCPDGTYLSESTCKNCYLGCSTCSSYKYCLSCSESRKVPDSNGVCQVVCNIGEIKIDDWCFACPKLCGICSDKITCTECVDNSEIVEDLCTCIKGFKEENGTCIDDYFYATLTVTLIDNSNKVIIEYSATPVNSLALHDYNISVNGTTPSSIEFYAKSLEKHSFKLLFDEKVSEGNPINITIIPIPLYSTLNSKLHTSVLQGTLFEYSPINSDPMITAVTEQSTAASQSAVSSSIGAALISNPAAAWAILNTIQFVTYFPLNSNSLTPGIRAFCMGIGDYNLLPNAMEYIFSPNSTSSPYKEASDYGVTSSVFWINIGPNISVFLAILAIWPFIFFISKLKIGKIAVKSAKFLGNYKYSIFLRFWIQTYLDVGVYSLIQLKAVRF